MDIHTSVREDVSGAISCMASEALWVTNTREAELAAHADDGCLIDVPAATLRPDVSVVQVSRVASSYHPVPVVLIDVEVGHCTVRTFIERAREYFELSTVQRVVGFFIFSPRHPGCGTQDDAREWRFAALAVTFDRDPASTRSAS